MKFQGHGTAVDTTSWTDRKSLSSRGALGSVGGIGFSHDKVQSLSMGMCG